MNVPPEVWREKMNNLMHRRANAPYSFKVTPASDYKSHLSKVFIGESVLDVGCGDCKIKELIPDTIDYFGIDPHPINDYIYSEFGIEDDEAVRYFKKTIPVDTVIAFAVLDGCQDFDKAIENMKLIARKNIVILTGLDIPINQYHTFELHMEDFDSRFADWDKRLCEEVEKKVWLIEYRKIIMTEEEQKEFDKLKKEKEELELKLKQVQKERDDIAWLQSEQLRGNYKGRKIDSF